MDSGAAEGSSRGKGGGTGDKGNESKGELHLDNLGSSRRKEIVSVVVVVWIQLWKAVQCVVL